jgi:hypothetical protein
MKETDLLEQLKDISANVNSWLTFAEAKNGALLALDSGLALAITSIVLDRCMPRLLLWYFYSAISFTVVSLLVVLLSFLPQSHPSQGKPRSVCEQDNLWFYGDIAQYDSQSYLEALRMSIAETDVPENRLCVDLAGQVIANSRIAVRKYTYFRAAIWLLMAGVLTPPIGIAVCVWVKRRNS